MDSEAALISDLVVHCIEIDTHSSVFGCCGCCPGDTPKFIRPQFYPQSLLDVVSQEDLYKLLDDFENKFHSTGAPLMPNALCFMCLWPLIFDRTCIDRRKKDTDWLVKDWNARHRDEGVYVRWNTAFFMTHCVYVSDEQMREVPGMGLPGLNVMVNEEARETYLANQTK